MSDKNGKLFKSRMFGFSKKDVTEYIEMYAKKCEANFAELRGHDEYLAKQLEEKDKIIEDLQKRYEQKEADCDAACKRIAELEGEKEQLAEKLSGYEEQIEGYNEIKIKLAEIEVDAHKRAAQIEHKANEAAREMFEKSARAIKQMSESVAPIFTSTREQVKNAEQSLSELKYRLNKISPEVFEIPEGFLEQTAADAASGNKTAEQMCGGIDEFVKKLRQKKSGSADDDK